MDGNASTAYNALEHMLLDETEEPRPLPLFLLETITNNFSDEMKLGSGGFATVYKGVLGSRTVAVKKLSESVDIDEKQFINEVRSLMKVRHKNIVRFLGYCADTQGLVMNFEGKSIMADVRNRALCFEYVPNGSIDNYITDASRGLKWMVRYKMIKGICEGLHYLHGNHILHLDLKPANILVDDNMVPKIADFGLSRLFDENQSKMIATTLIGSLGYLAPEFYSGKITLKLDIYSLGVVIMEILTGEKAFSTAEEVLESWRNRLELSQEDLQQIRVCAEIGMKCMETNPANRPTTQDMIKMLMELGGPSSEEQEPKTEEGRPVGLVMDASFKDNNFEYLQIIKDEDLQELRELGSGTFGTVYHGKWMGIDVAIKRIKKSCFTGRSSELERLLEHEFCREAEILSKLHHPNVVGFYGVVKDGPGGTLATVNEFMVNGSLRHVLQRKYHLNRRNRLIIAMDAAFGLEYLHSKNIVHFDLKCDNLLVNLKDQSRPICKVGDFGLSKIKRNTLVSGGVRSVLPWMAPELLNGSSNKVSEKVDVFSFGIVMWEILTGEEPYANMHYGAIIGGIVNNTLRPPVLELCDPAWRWLMEQCWAPDPAQRPAFTEIARRLHAMSFAAN